MTNLDDKIKIDMIERYALHLRYTDRGEDNECLLKIKALVDGMIKERGLIK
jgi:hypothetical protein